MQERHQNRKQYFLEQGITTEKYVIPYISEFKTIDKSIRVLEIGCGEGGNLPPFIEKGCEVIGVDLNGKQIANAKEYIKDAFPDSNTLLLNKNIYDLSTDEVGTFDVIMLRDVIEHIPHQEKFLAHLRSFLKTDGIVFFGFPPWWMPFGGHQQTCRSKFLSKLPYFHLLPNFMYKFIVSAFGESEGQIEGLMETKATGIGINRFLRIVKSNNFQFVKKTFYLINPNYEIKFKLQPREQFGLIKAIPYFRDFFTTCFYCVIKLDEKS